MNITKIEEVKNQSLPEEAQVMVDLFDMCAQRHGWEADQGNHMDAENARVCYEQAKAELECYIIRLLNNQIAN